MTVVGPGPTVPPATVDGDLVVIAALATPEGGRLQPVSGVWFQNTSIKNHKYYAVYVEVLKRKLANCQGLP